MLIRNSLDMDCNSAGAGFVVAFSDFSLHQIGNLVHPNLGFRHLAIQTLDNVDSDNQPLFILQVLNSFTTHLSLSTIYTTHFTQWRM